MISVATVKVVHDQSPNDDDDYEINVDIDDSGWAYIKQGDDWVCFPVKQRDELIRALQSIHVE